MFFTAQQADPFMLKAGDQHFAVLTVKRFLNAYPHVNCRLLYNDLFCPATRAALAEYQRYKRLTVTDGSLNAETYRAIGNDMLPAQIDMAERQDAVLGSLLNGLPLTGHFGGVVLKSRFPQDENSPQLVRQNWRVEHWVQE